MIDGEPQWFPISSRLEANSADALLVTTIKGLGIAYAPTFIVEQPVRQGKLEIILSKFVSPEVGIYAVFPSNRYVPHRVRSLVEFLAQRIGPKPTWDEILKITTHKA